MEAVHRPGKWLEEAAREHWLPLLILVAPVIWCIYQADKASNAIPMLPLPIVAFLVGLVLRPRRVWLLWLGAVVIEWVAVIVWGKYDVPGSGETLFSIMIEAFAWMALGVLLPVWLGRLVRAGFQSNPNPGQTPPA